MKISLQFLVVCVAYNAIMLILSGLGVKDAPFHWLNVIFLVTCSAAVFLHVAIGRRFGYENQAKFFRRFLVFLLGGFMCGQCGDARVKIGLGYMPCYTCPSCGKFYFFREPSSVKTMWRGIWRRR